MNILPGWHDTRSNPAANCSFYQPRLRRKSCELSSFFCFLFKTFNVLLLQLLLEIILLLGIVCKNDSELGHYTCHVTFLWSNLSHTDYFLFLFFVELWSLHSLFFWYSFVMHPLAFCLYSFVQFSEAPSFDRCVQVFYGFGDEKLVKMIDEVKVLAKKKLKSVINKCKKWITWR